MPVRVRVKVALGVARALAFLHSHSVAHGTLQSGNVMVDKVGRSLGMGWGRGNGGESVSRRVCQGECVRCNTATNLLSGAGNKLLQRF